MAGVRCAAEQFCGSISYLYHGGVLSGSLEELHNCIGSI